MVVEGEDEEGLHTQTCNHRTDREENGKISIANLMHAVRQVDLYILAVPFFSSQQLLMIRSACIAYRYTRT